MKVRLFDLRALDLIQLPVRFDSKWWFLDSFLNNIQQDHFKSP